MAAIVIAAVAVAVSIIAIVMARRAILAAAVPHSKTLRELLGAVGRGEIERVPALLRQLDQHLARIEKRVDRTEAKQAACVQKIGLVRFDADPELGGKVSFSLALLDENDDGIIVTSVYRLEDSRIFLREVSSGRTQHELMEEEARALNMALDEDLQRRRWGRRKNGYGRAPASEEQGE